MIFLANPYIGDNRKEKKNFFSFFRYAEKTKPNTLESKPREEYLYFLKRRFRNVPIVPGD